MQTQVSKGIWGIDTHTCMKCVHIYVNRNQAKKDEIMYVIHVVGWTIGIQKDEGKKKTDLDCAHRK